MSLEYPHAHEANIFDKDSKLVTSHNPAAYLIAWQSADKESYTIQY